MHIKKNSFLAFIFSIRTWVIGIPYLWLILFFILPFIVVIRVSLSEEVMGIPPYTDILVWVKTYTAKITLNFESYAYLIENNFYLDAYFSSINFALVTALISLFLGFPIALGISTLDKKWQTIAVLLIMLPFWTSFLIRIYAWLTLLTPSGLINSFLISCGLIKTPLHLLFTDVSIILGMVYCYLPFMIFPIYITLEKMNPTLQEAASDLGAKPFTIFRSITLPLSFPGILAGGLLVFIPCVGEFVVPEILGGASNILIGRLVWQEFFLNHSWPTATALAVSLLCLLFIPIYLLQKIQNNIAEKMDT